MNASTANNQIVRALFLSLVAVSNAISLNAAFDLGLIPKPLVAVAVVYTVVGIAVVHVWFYFLMQRKDEFIRSLMIKRFVVAGVTVLSVCTLVGFLQLYGHAPVIALAWVPLAFWAAYALASLVIRTTR